MLLKGRELEQVDVEYWHTPDRNGWLMKQGEYIKTWRRRFVILKQGHIFWFKTDDVSKETKPRGVLSMQKCLSIKAAEDIIGKQHAFELQSVEDTMYFVAESDKEKEEWINSLGRSIVRHSQSLTEDIADYT